MKNKIYHWLARPFAAGCYFLALLGMLAACQQSDTVSQRRKPNVILILADDQGYGDMSCSGNPWLKTPHIDELYNTGVVFQNYHVDPTCAPTRAALMTGRYSARVGVWMTYMGRHHLNREETTMADVFQHNGYQTAIFGKWHLGDNYPFRPSDRGFAHSLVHGGGVIGETPDYWGNDYYDDTYIRNNKNEKVKGYCTDVWFEEAKKFISNNKDNPFFVYLALNAPHGPLNVPYKYVKPYLNNPEIPEKRAWFYGMIAAIDENLGAFKGFLDQHNLSENTIFIYMTDNGTANGFSDGPAPGYNAGMRGKKGTPYEGGHRVSCILKWPAGGYQQFQEVNRLTAHIDMLPTLIDLAALEMEEPLKFDGQSLVPLLETTTAGNWPDRTLYVHNQITFGQKLENDLPVKYKKYAVMTDRWRLVNGELFDMKADAGQKYNVASKFPDVAKRLSHHYEGWWEDISKNFGQYNRTIIGAAEQEQVVLSAQFWHGDDVPYNQQHVRNAMKANGFWDINVETPGAYTITLRRWPKEADKTLQDLVPEPDVDTTRIYKNYTLYKLKSNAINIISARLQIGDFDETVPVSNGQTAVKFEVMLDKGDYFLQTWFYDTAGDSLGAYYVYIDPATEAG